MSAVKIELLDRPGRIAEHEIAEMARGRSCARRRSIRGRPPELAARREAGDLALELRIDRRRIDRAAPFSPARASDSALVSPCGTAARPDRTCSAAGFSRMPSFTPSGVARLDDRTVQELTLRLRQSRRLVRLDLRDA